MERKKWIPKVDACDECKECDYFLHGYLNCQGYIEPCFDFEPKRGSKKKMVEIVVEKDNERQM